jgi:hypothetical protein
MPKEAISVEAPEAAKPEIVGAHIERKRGKFHGEIHMSDGSKHIMAPHASMPEAHEAMGAQMAEHVAGPSNDEQNAEIEPLPEVSPNPAKPLHEAYRNARNNV